MGDFTFFGLSGREKVKMVAQKLKNVKFVASWVLTSVKTGLPH